MTAQLPPSQRPVGHKVVRSVEWIGKPHHSLLINPLAGGPLSVEQLCEEIDQSPGPCTRVGPVRVRAPIDLVA